MLNISKKSIHKPSLNGQFFCPGCEDIRTYKMMHVFDAVTFWGVVLKKGEERSKYVHCNSCASRFEMDVLEVHEVPNEVPMLAVYNDTFTKIVHLMITEHTPAESQLSVINEHLALLTGKLDPKEENSNAVTPISREEVTNAVKKLATQLNDKGSRIFLNNVLDMAKKISGDTASLRPIVELIAGGLNIPEKEWQV
jgi:transcription elongation factor Elf1